MKVFEYDGKATLLSMAQYKSLRGVFQGAGQDPAIFRADPELVLTELPSGKSIRLGPAIIAGLEKKTGIDMLIDGWAGRLRVVVEVVEDDAEAVEREAMSLLEMDTQVGLAPTNPLADLGRALLGGLAYGPPPEQGDLELKSPPTSARCRCCNRRLTDPESLANGQGRLCRVGLCKKKMFG